MTTGEKERDRSERAAQPAAKELREARLAQALRDNLQRRKQQSRARGAGKPADEDKK